MKIFIRRKKQMISLNESRKIVETDTLQVFCNALVYQDSVIQIQNIARISVSPIEKKPLPIGRAVILAIIGLFLLNLENSLMIFAGLVCILGGIGNVIYVYAQNADLGHYLLIELSSGKNYYFSAKDQNFLQDVMKILGECMNDKKSNYTFDMRNAKIEKMQVGNSNTIR